MDRKSRLARIWSNEELAKIAPILDGEVVNVSAWKDSDKDGRVYQDYFPSASSYWTTNFDGVRGSGADNHGLALDLTGELPEQFVSRFDVVFNHTTLEHIFDTRSAFSNLSRMSRDVLIVVVPFSQVQHETESWGDYWRFTPTCLREMFRSEGFEVIYESANSARNAAVYLFFVGARKPEKWVGQIPSHEPITQAGNTIGDVPIHNAVARVRWVTRRLLRAAYGRLTPTANGTA